METPAALAEQSPNVRPRHLVIVANTDSPGFSAVQPGLARLYEMPTWATSEWINTDGEGEYIPLLQKTLAESDGEVVVCVAGGDGTKNKVVDSTVGSQAPKKVQDKDLRFMFVGTGTKCDLAHMLHGDMFDDPEAILANGSEIDIYPLVATFGEGTDEEREVTALYSFGLGAIALGSEIANSDEFRKNQSRRRRVGKWIAEQGLGLRSILEMAPFNTDKGRLINLLFAGGERMGGGEMRFRTKLTSKREFVAMHTSANVLSTLGNIASVLTGLGQTTYETYRTVIKGRVRGQVDGEKLDFHVPRSAMSVRRGKALRVIAARGRS